MKRNIIGSIAIIFIILLAGCDEPTTQETCLSYQVYNPDTNTCDQIVEEDVIKKVDRVEIKDYMSMYELNPKYIDVFKHEDDSTRLVDIRTFLTQTTDIRNQVTYDGTDRFTIEFKAYLGWYARQLHGSDPIHYRLTFYPTENTITISDFNIFSRMNKPIEGEPGYISNLRLTETNKHGQIEDTVIHLDDYGMKIYEEDGRFYIPIYLTGLFLTGNIINVYDLEDSIVLFDINSDLEEVNEVVSSTKTDSLDIIEDSENYLKLLFEYFYGLDELTNIDYDDLINSYEFTEQESFIDYYTQLDQFLIDIDDLHSNLLYTGYNVSDYERINTFEEGTRDYEFHQALADNSCDLETESYILTLQDTTLVARVNAFNQDIYDLIEEILSFDSEMDTLIIDLRCNTGGSLITVLELLTVVTDEDLNIPIRNVEMDFIDSEYYRNQTLRAVTAEVIVLTSPVTFSGGNLFASVIQDQNAATVIGTKTQGGGCAISLQVLPDGSIIVLSSNLELLNKNFHSIEYGVMPDIILEDIIDPFTYDFETLLSSYVPEEE